MMTMTGRMLGVAAGLVALLAAPVAAGELDRLREENARLQQRVRDLEAENAKLRGATKPGAGG
jgi:cell division protein FtsB